MTRLIAVLCGAVLSSSCVTHWGPDEPLKPEGATVTVQTIAGQKHDGVLVAVTADGIILDQAREFHVAPFVELRWIKVKGYGKFSRFTEEQRVALALYATYPQGLTPEQRARLLEHRGQAGFKPLPLPPAASDG